MGDLRERSLVSLARACEDAAAGLHSFRDKLPHYANSITGCVGRLFDISSRLQELYQAQGDQRYASSFNLVQNDLAVLRPTLNGTLDAILEMFGHSGGGQELAAWNGFTYRMERSEGAGLFLRLGWYIDFLTAQFNEVTGQPGPDPVELRRVLVQLTEKQEDTLRKARRRSADVSASITPRPNQGRPRATRRETPRSPTSSEGSYRPDFMPFAPEAPQPVPLSPTFTSSSSQTMNSSHTSYSSDFMPPPAPALVHWAQRIFDGKHPDSAFRGGYQSPDSSKCYGDSDQAALSDLLSDGFIEALELRAFNQGNLSVRLYFKPSNSRAYVLIAARGRDGREKQYCEPLTELKIIREDSVLKLCKPGRRSSYECWAQLNFYLFERMVLFYCTFVAMKRQDKRDVPHEDLLDEFELRGSQKLESLEFAGQIVDGKMVHALRIWRDPTSGVFRLEASAFRGPMKDVPLWTAFITRYAVDPDHVQRESSRTVSLAALKPPPYVFLAGYHPLRDELGQYMFRFTSTDDASHFMETWAGLRRAV